MTNSRIREATPQDASAIRDLTRAAYAKWVPLLGREPTPMTVDYEVAVRQHRFDLLIADGDFTGVIETVPEEDALLIENVAVLPAFQGQGLGRILLSHAERLARELGVSRLRLYTNQRFSENIRLYLRVGYTIEREEQLGVGVAVHMCKVLGTNLA